MRVLLHAFVLLASVALVAAIGIGRTLALDSQLQLAALEDSESETSESETSESEDSESETSESESHEEVDTPVLPGSFALLAPSGSGSMHAPVTDGERTAFDSRPPEPERRA